MSFQLIPELRIIFDDTLVKPQGKLNRPGVYHWKDVAGNPIAWSSTTETGGWFYWDELVRFVFNKAENQVIAYAPLNVGHEFINQIFLQNTIPFVLNLRGYEALHASAVLTSRGVIAFCAVSGTGKSTFAYALRTRGYSIWADDVVIFHHKQGGFLCEAIPFDLSLYPEMIAEVDSHTHDPSKPNNKSLKFYSPEPLAAICLLERHGLEKPAKNHSILLLPLQEAFTRLLPHVYSFQLDDHNRNRQMLITYLNVVSMVPVYKLTYSSGLDSLHNVFDSLEKDIF